MEPECGNKTKRTKPHVGAAPHHKNQNVNALEVVKTVNMDDELCHSGPLKHLDKFLLMTHQPTCSTHNTESAKIPPGYGDICVLSQNSFSTFTGYMSSNS